MQEERLHDVGGIKGEQVQSSKGLYPMSITFILSRVNTL